MHNLAASTPTLTAQIGAFHGRILLGAWSLFWVLMLVISVQEHVVDGAHRWWEPFVWEGSSAITASILAWVMLRYLAGPSAGAPGQWLRRLLPWLPLLCTIFVVTNFGLRHGIYALANTRYFHESWSHVFLYESLKFFLFFGLWIGIVFGLHSFSQWREQNERLQRLQKALAEAQLAQLKAQLRPHFLFNTLNTISSMMQVDVARADRLLTRLADLLRISLTAGERDTVSLQEELRLLQLYASIMEERFTDRVSVHWRIPEDMLGVPIPTLLLQPLLENAFKHGVEPSTAPQVIDICAHRDDTALHVMIRNTCAKNPDFGREGVGLRNCRERLQVLYGDAATLSLTGGHGEVTATVSLPASGAHA
jgi:two-component sensor histidine kinase